MADGPGGDRTERATPRRREQARRRGQVARSSEINAVLVLLCGVSLLLLSGGHLARLLGRNASYLFAQSHLLRADNLGGLREILVANLGIMLQGLAPLLLAIFVTGLGANVMQVGFHASGEAIMFRGERINPFSGLKRLVSKRAFFDLLKNLLKIALVSLVAYLVLRGRMGSLLQSATWPLQAIVGTGKLVFAELMYKVLGALAILALADWAFQKWQHEENLKMTRAEAKQDLKDTEGDPQVRARVRAIQLETARKRMLADVPQADVVVTNPDHLAVAIRYSQGEPAPRVVAKGRNHLAEVIKRIARQARVPVLENKPVAQSLYRHVKVGGWIPEALYQAVAEILAYVYRLRRA
jgi:flagellar biosynthetic protein FlhB